MRYDLGSNDEFLSLADAVDDGAWHRVVIKQYANQVIMMLDAGEGHNYVESSPSNNHRLITLWDKEYFAGAEVVITEFSKKKQITANTDYVNGKEWVNIQGLGSLIPHLHRTKIIWIAIWILIQKMYPFTWDIHRSIQLSTPHCCLLISHCFITIHLISGLELD